MTAVATATTAGSTMAAVPMTAAVRTTAMGYGPNDYRPKEGCGLNDSYGYGILAM